MCKGGGGDGVHLAPTNSPTVKPSSPADEGKPFLSFFSLCARQHLTIDPHYDIIISFSLQLFIQVCSLYISPEHEKKGKRRSYTYYASFKYLE